VSETLRGEGFEITETLRNTALEEAQIKLYIH
jgi:hypothetical protein